MNVRDHARSLPPRFSRDVRAFTLIELMLVVAVVAILATLLLPILATAQSSVRRLKCSTQLRSMILASQMYWDDNDRRLFPFRAGSDASGDLYWFGWLERGAEGARRFDESRAVLFPYLRSAPIRLCPAFDYKSSRYKPKAIGASHGYGYNLHLSAPFGAPSFRIDVIRNVSACVTFADSAQINTFQPPATADSPLIEEFYYLSTWEPTVHFRHGTRAVVAFADGHVGVESGLRDGWDLRVPDSKVGRLRSELLAVQK